MQGIADEALRDYGLKINDDVMLLRYLRARSFNVEQAHLMMVETLKFRLTFQDKGVDAITYEDCLNEMACGKSFFRGRDKDDRPVGIIRSRCHDPAKSEKLESERFAVCTMEYGRKLLKAPGETVTLIFDMTGATMKNIDYGNIKFMVKTLQSYYPECLHKVLIFNSTWLFWGVWKLVKPLLDPVTAEKIAFVDKKTIKDFIDSEHVLAAYGGNDTWEYNVQEYTREVGEAMSGSPPGPACWVGLSGV